MTAAAPPLRILFVCSGNICRSPMAEALFKSMAAESGVASSFTVDSAGTHGFHEGEPADPRTRRTGRKHGLDVDSLARPVVAADFERFDLIVAMDRGHRSELLALGGTTSAPRIRLMREFEPDGREKDVADPYYGGPEGFEAMYQVLEVACRGLLRSLLP